MKTDHPLYVEDLNTILDGIVSLEPLRGATVLITGSTGMIGACLTDALSMANRLFHLNLRILAGCRNLARAQSRFSGMDGVEPIAFDVSLPPDALPQTDYIIHAASNAHPAAFSVDPVGTMLGNILGTQRLLDHLRKGGRRLLFVSSGEIYGENPSITDGFSEEDFGKIDSMNPRSCYPESKRAAETLCASYVRQYGVDAVVARLCYTYGPTVSPSNTRADAQFLQKALAQQDIVMKSPGAQLRSYCYVADTTAALLTLLLRGERGCAYNVSNRSSVHTIREYAEVLARLAGVQVTFDLPPEIERAGYSTVSRAVQNPSRLEALGWKPHYSLHEGLRRTLEILRDDGVC